MNALLSNPFKRGLLRGETQIGLWLSSTSSYMAEIAATSGYDWLLIDGEHAPNTIQDLYHQLQAIAPYASQPVIRPVEGNRSLIKQKHRVAGSANSRIHRGKKRSATMRRAIRLIKTSAAKNGYCARAH